VIRESGVGGCSLKRRSRRRSVLSCYHQLFCKLMWRIAGFRSYMPFSVHGE